MDSSETTKTVFSRIQSIDPENASKIMGFIYIHDPGEKEMIRLAFGPEALLLSLINQAKTHFELSSNTSSTSFASSMSNPNRPSPLPQSSPRIIIPNNGFHVHSSSTSTPWSVSGFTSPRPASSSLSYAAVVNGSSSNAVSVTFSPPISSSLSLPPLYRTNNDLSDGYNHDRLSLLDDSMSKSVDFGDPIMSPSGRSDSMLLPYGNAHQPLHRRSYSVNDEILSGGSGSNCGFEDGGTGFGWRPCMYFARGFCKNGESCKFLHSRFVDSHDASAVIGGSPSKLDGFDELLRMKAIQQQRFAAASQRMAGVPFPYEGINFDSPRSAAAPLMIGEEFHKFASCRPERNEFLRTGGNANSSSRQIYLTFPADSTFKEEDVSNYFSNFGPVQDVRIPYQQKRMFGFVTFVFPETVKMILAKGNPHFICDSRVLVKPYKEKGKIPDRNQQQYQLDIGEFSSPGLEFGEQSYDPLGATMFYNTKEMMLRRKMEEQAELQQAIELQGRRLLHLQLMDLRNHHRLGHQLHPHIASGVPVSPPPHPHLSINPNLVLRSHGVIKEVSEVVARCSIVATDQQNEVKEACDNSNGHEANDSNVGDNDDFHESLEHTLPDNLFASPTKSARDHGSVFSSRLREADGNSSVTTTASSSNTIPLLPSTSAL